MLLMGPLAVPRMPLHPLPAFSQVNPCVWIFRGGNGGSECICVLSQVHNSDMAELGLVGAETLVF